MNSFPSALDSILFLRLYNVEILGRVRFLEVQAETIRALDRVGEEADKDENLFA